jgi:hypothetical protein
MIVFPYYRPPWRVHQFYLVMVNQPRSTVLVVSNVDNLFYRLAVVTAYYDVRDNDWEALCK